MTTDERLEKLIERHEALTQTVELMAAENRDRDERFGKMLVEHDKRFHQILDGMEHLLQIAEIHERRIEHLEGGN